MHKNSKDVIKDLRVESTYQWNDVGLTIYDYIFRQDPRTVIEFGVLHGYSAVCIGLALKDLDRGGKLICYDLWEDYPYKRGKRADVQALVDKHGLSSFVELRYGDVYEWLERPEHFDVLHLDISNNGDRIKKMVSPLEDSILAGGDVLFEGGTLERDEVGWQSDRGEVSKIAPLQAELGFTVLDHNFPGLSLISASRRTTSPGIRIYDLECHSTPEGSMFPIYRDWDNFHEGYVPEMVYASTMAPDTEKGPILHRKRREYITAISGEVQMEYYEHGNLHRVPLRNKDGVSKIVTIPPGVPKKLINVDRNSEAVIINLPSPAWRPEDQDTEKFTSWMACIENLGN
jgi:predicted O-methyltransferase YrrM/uncharacterized RmlC-like cupin family protein